MPGEAAKSVSRTIGVLSLTKVLTWVSSSALMFVLPRFLGPEEYGRLFLGTSIVMILGVVVDFGREYSVAKAISREREKAGWIVVNAVSARTLIGVAAYIGMIIFAAVVHYPPEVRLILIILGIALFWRGASGVLWSFFQGIEMMKYPSYGGIIESFSVAILSIAALMAGAGATTLAGVMLLCGFINVLVCSGFAWRLLGRLPRIDWHEAGRLLKQGFPYFLNSLFGIIYYRVGTVMLSLMTSDAVVGWYGAAIRLFDILMFIPSIFSISVFPVLARHWEDKDALSRMTKKSIDFILLTGIPIAVGTIAFASPIINLIFGFKGYAHSVAVMRVFGAGLLLVYIDMMLGTTLLATDKQRQLSISAFLAIFVNVGLNFWLIPATQAHFGNGGIGAGIATVVTEFFILLTMLAMMPRHILRGSTIGVQMKAIAAGAAMGLVAWGMLAAGIHWIASGIVSCGVYVGVVFLLKAVQPHELSLISAAIPIARFFARGKSRQ